MPDPFPRCRIIPLPDHQVAFEIEGGERLRWHFGPAYPRPFFYPFIGPSGSSLTRMGHPGAPDHDHHRSIWFAHARVLGEPGVDFWTDRAPTRIRQTQWLCYQDGDAEAVMAVSLGWYDGHNPKELMQQEVVAGVRPGPNGETLLELQATFRPAAEALELGKTNFGFLAVRVAKNLSAHFGGGVLTGSAGGTGETALFGRPAAWMDYSGPVPKGSVEGITCFDHPSNPNHPTPWHVRDDGWMGASPCLSASMTIRRERPLVLRYLLHAHRGPVARERAADVLSDFARRPAFEVRRSKAKHQQHEVVRLS